MFKVQMKCSFFMLNLKEQQKSGRSPFTVSNIFSSFRVIGIQRLVVSDQSARKSCRNQSKSIKFVALCAGHVDGMKK